MAILNEGRHAGEFMVSEASGNRSRSTETIAKSTRLDAGTVLGRITSSSKFTAHNPSASDGSQTAIAVLYDNVDASDSDAKAVVIARSAEVALEALVFADGITAGNKTNAVASLADAGIIGR